MEYLEMRVQEKRGEMMGVGRNSQVKER